MSTNLIANAAKIASSKRTFASNECILVSDINDSPYQPVSYLNAARTDLLCSGVAKASSWGPK